MPGSTDGEEGRQPGCGPRKLLPLTATRSKLALQPQLSPELSNTSNLLLCNIHLFQTTQELPLKADMLHMLPCFKSQRAKVCPSPPQRCYRDRRTPAAPQALSPSRQKSFTRSRACQDLPASTAHAVNAARRHRSMITFGSQKFTLLKSPGSTLPSPTHPSLAQLPDLQLT